VMMFARGACLAVMLAAAAAVPSDNTTTVYLVEETQCGQATLASQFAEVLEQFAHAQEGTCADQGYTTAEGSKTVQLPTVGEVTFSLFSKSVSSPLDDTTVYVIEQTQCAQATLAAQYAALLEQALHAQAGTCNAQGYTTAEGTKSITLPTVGEVTLSVFTKSAPRQLMSVEELKKIPANFYATEVNAKKTTWTAHDSPRFTNGSLADVKRLCGTVRPHETGFFQLPPKVFAPIDTSSVPDAFDSRTQWPQCASVIGHIRDQSDCGSCWAFGSTEAFNDRRCIKTGDTTILSADDTTACCGFLQCQSMGCGGGQPGAAWSWFTHTGVVTGGDYGDNSTCLPYAFPPCAHHVPATDKYPACPSSEYPSPKCSKTCASSQYKTAYADDKHKASRAYSVNGAASIQQEILTNGPVTGAFTVYADFPTYRTGVYKHTSGSELGGHAIKIIGWGVDSGTPYWLVANSWNEQWGDGGLFKILRGSDECGIESQISAGMP